MRSNFFSCFVYPILYALLLPTHMLNSMEVASGIKLWYVPVVILAFLGFMQLGRQKKDKFFRLGSLFVFLSFVSVLVGGVPVLVNCVELTLLFLAILPLQRTRKSRFYQLSPFLFIIAIYFSFIYANWDNEDWRFQGMYNDPNYLVTSLIVGIYLCVQAFICGNKVMKAVSVVAILCALYTIVVTQSRGGIIALLVFAFFIAVRGYQRSKVWFFFVAFLLLVTSTSVLSRFSKNVDNIMVRFSGERVGDRSGAMSRFEEINTAQDVIEKHPWILLTGGGYGITGSAKEMLGLPYKYNNDHRIHNTLFAVLFEQGIIAFVVFCMMIVVLLRRTWKTDNIKFGLLLAVFIQSMTIWLIPYMPLWLTFAECAGSKRDETDRNPE